MELFYREGEIKLLRRQLWMSKEQRSRMTVVTGKTGSGKTALVAKALEGETFLYFRAGGKTPHLLLQDYLRQVRQKLELYVPSRVVTFPTLLEFLFDSAHKRHFTIVIDNLEILVADPTFIPFLAELWDSNKRGTHINLILVSNNTFVTAQLFDNEQSPLVNTADCRINLGYYTVAQLKELMLQKGSDRTSEDLLAFYMATGGMPDLTLAVMAATDGSKDQIFNYLLASNSPLESVAARLLSGSLGKNADVYFSILQLIASGTRTQAAIEDSLGGMVIGGHLAKLETEYQLITKTRPVLASATSRNVVRYCITDLFLLFWLKYIEANRSTLEIEGYQKVREIAFADFENAGKQALVRYFTQKFSEQNGIDEIGSDWAAAKPLRSQALRREYYYTKTRRTKPAPAPEAPLEIDIVALDKRKNKALVADVCLSASQFRKDPFLERLAVLKKGPLKGYLIDSRVFTIEDM